MIDLAVVDASVGIKLFLLEPDSDLAERFFAGLSESPQPRYFVPSLFYVECANILWKYSTFYGYPEHSAQRDLEDLQALALESIPTEELLPDALHLALGNRVTVYDAVYGALAIALRAPLVTADMILAEKLRSAGCDARLLSTLQ